MGLARNFNKAIHRELASYAAWWPVVNTFKVGDYGMFNDGVFQSMGNLKDKYPDIDLKIEPGGTADIDFTSEGTRKIKVDAEGKPIDTFAGLGEAEVALQLIFEHADSSMIKAKMSIQQLGNIDAVGTALANKPDWRNKFCVVSAIYTGQESVVICSKEAGTQVTIKASASVLQQVEAGKVSGNFEFQSSRESVFKAIGESGVLALRLFKLNIFNKPRVLTLQKGNDFDIQELSDAEIADDEII